MDRACHILVVDDDYYISDILKNVLEDEGFKVTVVSDGQEALEVFKNSGADLILLDIKMPGLDGYEVIEKLRQESQVPVIVLSGTRETDAVARMMEKGANDYVTKPFRERELLARVRAKIRRARICPN
jgi:two-component system, OmpR family, response regulator MtrA